MYAIIRTGGKQYRVAPGDVITVEKLAGAAGDTVALDEVLAVGEGADLDVGTPLVAGATVAAEVVEQGKGDKILVFKKKRRKRYRRTRGHRQLRTRLKITAIQTGETAKTAEPKKSEPKKTAAAKTAGPKKTASRQKSTAEATGETPAKPDEPEVAAQDGE